ncbi:MAG: hypothetical protein K6G34_08970 [Lachnospiraceae bacterium]|nr:hypothetical protein [Lachnospiraceae bacterium]
MSGSHDFFDFNHDGKLDALEWSAKMEFYDELSRDNSAKHNGTVRPSRRNRADAGKPALHNTGSGSGSNAAQNEKVEIDPAVWVFLKIILAAAGVLILYFAFTGIKHDMDRNAEVRKVESRLEEYGKLAPEELPKFCGERGIGLDGTYTAKVFPELTISPGSGQKYQFYSVNLDYEVTLQTAEYFDSLDDRAKYNYLGALYQMSGEAYDAFLQESFRDLVDLHGWTTVEGLSIAYKGGEYEVYIETPAHRYQYSRMYDDLFILDGESYFLMDEKSRWNK